MRIFNKGDQFLRYIVIKTAAQVLIMIESQYGIQSCIDRFRPVFRLQIQRDDLFIYPRILQPGKKISQVIDCDCLPQQPPLVKVCEIMLQEDTCQTECIPRRTSIVPEPQVLQYWFYRCSIIICEVIPALLMLLS